MSRMRRRRRSVSPLDQVRCSAALDLARRLPDGYCDLIYVDPPFASRKRRTSSDGTRGYSDVWRGGLKAYLQFLQPHLVEFRRLLAPHGTLWVHLDWRAAAYVRIQLDTIFGPQNFLNEIIWHYRSGGVSRRWFGRKHDTILVYARQMGLHRFNPIRGGAYRTGGLKFDRGRPYKETRRGRLYFHVEGPALTDVWDIPFLSTVSNERSGWPTQKPAALLERIVRAGTNPGDLVADFFCGSGTTLAVARLLGRHWLGCDQSPQAVRIARERVRGAVPLSPASSRRARS
jgi:site-specific DNA-methyltransferase (adenine-specific)